MKIEQIRQVLAINRCGSINKAAEELFLSQPNLSISVKNLEDELGYRIFIRSSHGVRLTHHGKIFVQSASVVMDQFDSLARLKRLPKENEDEQELSLAIMPYRYLSHAVVSLYEAHRNSNLKLNLHSGSRDEIIESVFSGESELGILSIYSPFYDLMMVQLAEKNINFMQIGEVPLSIIVGETSPLYHLEGTTIHRALLKDKCFVALEEMECGALSSLPEILGLGESCCPQKIYSSSWSLMMDVLRQTDSFSIVGTNRKAYETIPYYHGLKTFQLKDCIYTSKMGWICRDGFMLSALGVEFLNLLYQYFD